ncbi:MAG: preprotein translocase subunit SecE [Elusimicrobia bacterium RIFCSPLOWO2_12_FULL_59_9]|nr:MAG: preprotein translocase subunit SecE [Elusimicrobia bacterium RIFCSPLOWO2_12_FULL_59_9]
MNPLAITGQFFKEVVSELRKVTWLSRQQMLGSTTVVIVLVVVLSLFVGAVDFLLSIFMGSLLGK